jgi:hypothetical protein
MRAVRGLNRTGKEERMGIRLKRSGGIGIKK